MRRRNRFVEQLLELPWWTSLCVAALVFVCVTYVIPAVMPTGGAGSSMADGLRKTGWIFSLPFVVAAASSATRQWLQRQLLEQEKRLDSIRELSWQAFETLIGEAFRRQGYSVTQHGGAAPGGSIDFVVEKAGRKSVVQCRQWQARQVDVTLVRELHGSMTAEGADEAILVTCGDYAGDARAFARGKPIRLINRELLLGMIRSVQKR